MNTNKQNMTSRKSASFWKKGAIALMASTLILGSYSQVLADPAPLQISQRQQEWDSVLRLGRLVNARQQVTSLVMQLDVLEKPETSYANAVYQIFARQDGRWRLIYSSTGARLINNNGGRVTLEPEVISLDDLQDALDDDDLDDVELRAVAQLRYDVRGGQRNQEVTWDQVQRYRAIAQTSTTQIASSQTSTTQVTSSQTTQTSTQTSVPVTVTGAGQPNNTLNPLRGHFSLAVLQSQPTFDNVIVRVSLKAQRPNAFLQERFVGDFRYRINQRARFIRGLNPGDRVVVRLFTSQNVLIGYSEFELLDDNAAVNLILPSQSSSYGTVRTVYGVDSDENGVIDANRNTYSYYTQVSGSSYRDSRVTFLSSTRNINTSLFQTQSISTSSSSVYSSSFESGIFSLVGRTIPCFISGLAPALLATPGEIVEISNISTSSISTYEVSQLILVYQEVGFTEGTIIDIDDYDDYEYDDDDDDDDNDGDDDDDDDYEYDDDDDDDGGRSRRRNCNQGIGNGSEGCDPGNSRPHGGSNDENGRTPGGRRR
ncbi:hypothetical protein H6F93_27735 [Leptolyngbya sp. FACHB-671]|uniref:hypothetical protein n=1 Tax=Leptolyngbya sp. FACHB-671 TaxID=2692812 RepID=UPI001683C915|nr:hypothetical protein [Leptolyngbya sp. FACHB-671]MBD2071261.1 hypothetical protein [Leptolyngbya sp. FACHB-671]